MTASISVRNLSKCYKVDHLNTRKGYRTVRESVVDSVGSVMKRIRGGKGEAKTTEDFWALAGLDFEVSTGEVVGIIGRNGAGKSTLLKILSRITKPTGGEIELRGRVGSLLEVGTGFHPELTGRENIFLNGSILGMSRREIGRRFDEIVAFSEIENFLDTPVKRYSSGMYVKLAFGVAAHLEPEILLVDEVLAVGDVKFQKKCLGKMREVGRSGRTVLFVSHNIPALEALCTRCILLARGRVKDQGETRSILAQYYEDGEDRTSGSRDLTEHTGRTKDSRPIMSRVALSDGNRAPISLIRMGSALSIHVDFNAKGSLIQPVLGIVIKTDLGNPVLGVNNLFIPGFEFNVTSEPGTITCQLEGLPLMPGTYLVDLYFSSTDLGHQNRNLDTVQEAIAFQVVPTDVFASGKLPPLSAGPIFWPATFSVLERPHGN
jgi:lipopolysaccharide transport system ATP-binding protein